MMQSGQPKQPDLIYEDRLAEMQRKYGVIQERIQAYDALLTQHSLIKGQVDDLAERLNSHVANFNSYKENQEKSFWSNEKVLKLHAGVQEKLAQSINEGTANAKSDRDSMLKEHVALVSGVDSLHQAINSLNDIVVDKTQIEEIMKHVFDEIDKVSLEKQPLKADIERTKLEHYKLANAVTALQEVPQKQNTLINTVSNDLQTLRKATADRADAIQTSVDASLKVFMLEHEKKLLAMKEEILGTPSSNAKVKEDLEQKLQMVALDGSNAVIKANNVDAQIKLLEKKLENLSLQVKRNELAK